MFQIFDLQLRISTNISDYGLQMLTTAKKITVATHFPAIDAKIDTLYYSENVNSSENLS